MKLMLGALCYIAVVGSVLAAALSGVFSVERVGPSKGPVLAHGSLDNAAERRARALEEAKLDPNRVPVWIVPTPKYQYTPQPVELQARRGPSTGPDTRAAMAATVRGSQDGLRAIDAALTDRPRGGGTAMGYAPTRRDNDPFYRD
jgi:hypothetical protein